MTQMNLSTKQKQTHRHREQTCGCQGGEGWGKDGVGVWDWQMQTIIYIGWIINKHLLLYSTGNSTHYYFVITYERKESGKEYLYKVF